MLRGVPWQADDWKHPYIFARWHPACRPEYSHVRRRNPLVDLPELPLGFVEIINGGIRTDISRVFQNRGQLGIIEIHTAGGNGAILYELPLHISKAGIGRAYSSKIRCTTEICSFG